MTKNLTHLISSEDIAPNFIKSHITSSQVTSPRLISSTSSQLIAFHFSHFSPCHLNTSPLTSSHLKPFHFSAPYFCMFVSYHLNSPHLSSSQLKSCHLTLRTWGKFGPGRSGLEGGGSPSRDISHERHATLCSLYRSCPQHLC